MKLTQRIELRRSEIRQRLAAIGAMTGDDRTDEIIAERDSLIAEYSGTEPELRAAHIAEDTDGVAREPQVREGDGERVELRGLIEAASLGAALGAMLRGGGHLRGPEAELAEHRGCRVGEIPIDLLLPRGAEHRAAVTTPAAGAGEHTVSRPVLPQIFPTPIAAFIGVERPMVPIGTSSFPYISAGSSVGTPSAGTAVGESSVAISAKTISPGRVAASVRFGIESEYVLPDLESALRQNMAAAIGDKLEEKLVDKLQSSDADSAPTAASTTIDYNGWRKLVVDSVDGTLAGGVEDMRAIVNVDSYRKLAQVDFATSADSFTAIDFSRQKSGGIMTSPHAKATSSNDAEVALIRGRHPGSIVQPVWSGVRVERDPYTDAPKGEIVLTATVLTGIAIPRAAVFLRESVQLA